MIYLYQRVLYKRGLFLLEGGFLTVKQPYNTTIYNTALYLRLSRDDELQGESGSIQTQENICQGGFHPKDEIPPLNKDL